MSVVRRCNRCGRGAGLPHVCEPCHAKVLAADPLHYQCPFPGCPGWPKPAYTPASQDEAIQSRTPSTRAKIAAAWAAHERRRLRGRLAVGGLALAAACATVLAFALSGCCDVPRSYREADADEYRYMSVLARDHLLWAGAVAPLTSAQREILARNLGSWRARLVQAGANADGLPGAPR